MHIISLLSQFLSESSGDANNVAERYRKVDSAYGKFNWASIEFQFKITSLSAINISVRYFAAIIVCAAINTRLRSRKNVAANCAGCISSECAFLFVSFPVILSLSLSLSLPLPSSFTVSCCAIIINRVAFPRKSYHPIFWEHEREKERENKRREKENEDTE